MITLISTYQFKLNYSVWVSFGAILISLYAAVSRQTINVNNFPFPVLHSYTEFENKEIVSRVDDTTDFLPTLLF